MDTILPNYYEVFGISADADSATIKKALLEKARLLVEAYQTLTVESSREQYDVALTFKEQVSTGLIKVPYDAPSLPISSDPMQSLKDMVVTLDGRKFHSNVKVNRRLLSRIEVDKPIFIRLSDKTDISGRLENLSGSGAKVSTKVKLEMGALIEIGMTGFQVPFVLAQVVRLTENEFEYGVKWVKIYESGFPKGIFSDIKR